MREALAEQPEDAALNTMPLAEGNFVEQAPKRHKPAKTVEGNQKMSTAPGGGDSEG